MSNSFKVTPDLYTSKGNRFAHYIVDIIIVLLIFYAILLGPIFLYYSFAEDTTAMDSFLDGIESNPLLDRLITAIVLALIYFAIESLTKGKSVGKFITKTKVVLEDGSRPSSSDFLKRSFSRMIPFEPFSFLGSEGRGWHDTISKTYVVDIDKFEAKRKSHDELDQIGAHLIEEK
ncbi:RDD family protein [Hyunsoonleella flava]|uniref:RDD family protein n=1 Tax=Hyunsoonleella flava TaxID=2527939 RepID=A0A4Q9FB93_9FLAO|nr:RDD family protein [Hyunsoonleella flava]TBN01902.1 RDD family protein [Hyunsoonleella flava]